MTTITLDKAQTELPDLIRRALEGEEIVITVAGQLVRLAPLAIDSTNARRRGWGCYAGQIVVPDSFFEPISDEECGLGHDDPGVLNP